MRIAVAVPEPHVSAPVLDAALEGVTRLNEELIKEGSVPTFRQAIDHVRWKPEPPGGEHFDHAGIVDHRGWGDCDDLAPWHAASLRVTGEDPGARAVARRSGPKRWHCEVLRSHGGKDDPSIEAGMPKPGAVVGTRPAVLPVMFTPQSVVGSYLSVPQLAIRPIGDRWGQVESWQARTDLPWHWQPGKSAGDVAMVSLHKSPITDQALVGACEGAITLGECTGYASEDDLDRLEAIIDACHGATWRELAEDYGPEHATAAGHIVGSFFGNIAKKISRAVKHPEKTLSWAAKTATMPARVALKTAASTLQSAKPLAAAAMPIAQAAAPFANFIPGVGPLASMAFQMASPMLQQLLQSGQHMPPQAMPGMPMPQSPWGMAPGMQWGR